MNKLFIMAVLLFVCMVVFGLGGLFYINSCYQRGGLTGFFAGAFVVFFLAFLKDWLRGVRKDDSKP